MVKASIVEPIDPDGKTLTKGTLMRGWSSVLSQRGWLERIAARLTPEVATLLRDPPAATQWIDVAYFECVAEAVRLEVGEPVLDELFVDAQKSGWVALLTRWGGGVVRVFGATPASVLRQAQAAARSTAKGMDIAWVETGERSGELCANYPHRARIHLGAAFGTSAACQLAADLVGATMKRERPVIEPLPGGGTRVRVRASW